MCFVLFFFNCALLALSDEEGVFLCFYVYLKVWAPVLLDSGKWSQQIDGKLQQLLTELVAGLGTAVKQEKGTGGIVHLKCIATP